MVNGEAMLILSHLLASAFQTAWQRSGLTACSPATKFPWSSHTKKHSMAFWTRLLVSYWWFSQLIRWRYYTLSQRWRIMRSTSNASDWPTRKTQYCLFCNDVKASGCLSGIAWRWDPGDGGVLVVEQHGFSRDQLCSFFLVCVTCSCWTYACQVSQTVVRRICL